MTETVLRRYSARFDVSSTHAKHVLIDVAEQHGIKLDRDSLEGYNTTWLGKVAGYRHRFSVESDGNSFVVSEDVFVSLRWHLLLLLPSLLMSLAILNVRFEIFERFVFLQAGLTLLCAIFVQLWSATALKATSVINQAASENRVRRKEYSALNFSIISAALLFSIFASAHLFGLGRKVFYVGLFLYFLTTSLHLFSVFSGGLLSNYFITTRLKDRLPLFTLSSSLAKLIIIGGGICVIFALGFRSSVNVEISVWIYSVMDIIILAIAITTVLGLFFYVRDMGVLGYSRFTEFGFVDSDRKVKIAAVGVITLLSYLLIYIGYWMVDLVFLRGDVSLLIRFSGLLILLGVAYFPAGIVYQTGRYWWITWRLLRDSKPVELPFEAGNTCLKIGFPGSDPVYFASTVSTGMSDYVVISEDLASDFEDDELEAVVRHEEEHIQSGDVRISFLIMIGSVLTLVGRNIYYVLIDFRGREFRADSKAASDVSPQSIKNALERFKNTGLDYEPQIAAAIVSFGGSGREAKGLYRYFDLFFGDYGIREAHPSIDERISKVKE